MSVAGVKKYRQETSHKDNLYSEKGMKYMMIKTRNVQTHKTQICSNKRLDKPYQKSNTEWSTQSGNKPVRGYARNCMFYFNNIKWGNKSM